MVTDTPFTLSEEVPFNVKSIQLFTVPNWLIIDCSLPSELK
ncbi:hypothetical protein AB4Y90_11160 [Chryseobacterium sp. 2TAF14]